MKRSNISRLGYALLGLISGKASSGYDIRRVFTNTPMGVFSDSPGAIYPALQRLEAEGLIRGQVHEGAGLRRRKEFRLTAAGESAFKKWLKQPVTRENVMHDLDELMLRFSFMEPAIGEAATVRFLANLQGELGAYVPELRGFLTQHKAQMPRSGALALESGVRQYEAVLAWCKHAISSYEENGKGGT